MFAVIEIAGSQFKVSPKDILDVNRLEAEEGTTININDVVLFSKDGKEASVGQPYVSGAEVTAKVVEHFKGDKVRVFKFTAKKRYQLTKNHRQHLTRLEITDIKG